MISQRNTQKFVTAKFLCKKKQMIKLIETNLIPQTYKNVRQKTRPYSTEVFIRMTLNNEELGLMSKGLIHCLLFTEKCDF